MWHDDNHNCFLDIQEIDDIIKVIGDYAKKQDPSVDVASLSEGLKRENNYTFVELLPFLAAKDLSIHAPDAAKELYFANKKKQCMSCCMPGNLMRSLRQGQVKNVLQAIKFQIAAVEKQKQIAEPDKDVDKESVKTGEGKDQESKDKKPEESKDKKEADKVELGDMATGVYTSYKRVIEFADLITSLILLN
jgi:hypothetical protein